MNFYGFSFIPGFLVFGCKKYFLIPLCVWLVLFVNILEFSCECQAGVAIRVGVSGSGPTRLRPDTIIFDTTRHANPKNDTTRHDPNVNLFLVFFFFKKKKKFNSKILSTKATK
jgi:hypothetical protein